MGWDTENSSDFIDLEFACFKKLRLLRRSTTLDMNGHHIQIEEGGCLVVSEVTAQPEQIAYAQVPVLYQLRASFAALPLGLSPEELAAQLPDPEVFVNYQGQMSSMLSVPAGRLSWDIQENWEDISAGRRTVLHALPNGPISAEGWPESELTPILFAPVTCELAILVDGAAIGQIIDYHTTYGSSYELY